MKNDRLIIFEERLSNTLLFDGILDVNRITEILNHMLESKQITKTEYDVFLEAVKCYQKDGHFRNSIIYKNQSKQILQ